jgi:ADP-heptose:LPS heptosyltransferase
MTCLPYEEQFDFKKRWTERGMRRARWLANAALDRPHNILVEANWRLGDEIMDIPIYEAIKKKWPQSRLTVTCNFPELLDGNPHVDAINQIVEPVDRYISLRGAPRGVLRVAHCARKAGVPVPAAPPQLNYEDWETPLLQGVDTGRLICLARGASWPTKQWPLSCWKMLCMRLEQRGFLIAELGTRGEEIGATISFIGKTDIYAAARVLHHARLLICSDSGLMHLALASGAKSLALFGPTKPSMLVHNQPNLHTIDNGRPCKACWNVSKKMRKEGVCPLNIPECLGTIGAERVADAALQIIGAG